jgi:hypothetical protein
MEALMDSFGALRNHRATWEGFCAIYPVLRAIYKDYCGCIASACVREKLDYECGSEFIDENGGGPGVRLRKRHQKKG